MAAHDIAAGVAAALRNFHLPPELGFGRVDAPVMFTAEFRGGQWERGQLTAHAPITLHPGARALHYGELVFEGMKAYRVGRGLPNLFRPDDHYLRLQSSSRRLSMPGVPRELFFQGIGAVTSACADHIPAKSGQALYLRPFLFGTESGYIVRNSATFRFMVIANPVEAYSAAPMHVAIERMDVRAAAGGLGSAKTSANYAGSLRATSAALARGCSVALWLDSREHRFIQELSGMNVFMVVNGELHTPALDGAILPGITRDSIIALAPRLGYAVHERPITIDELLAGLASGEVSEVFACGTGAIICPIAVLSDAGGEQYVPRVVGTVATRLRESLLAIQEKRAPDPFGWTVEIDPSSSIPV